MNNQRAQYGRNTIFITIDYYHKTEEVELNWAHPQEGRNQIDFAVEPTR